MMCRHPLFASAWPSPSPSSWNPPERKEEQELDILEHLTILDSSLKQHTNQGLKERMGIPDEEGSSSSSSSSSHWEDAVHMSSRFAVMSHGKVNGFDGPENNYVNFGACFAFSLPRQALLQIPACRVAKPGYDQETWSMILQRLRQDPSNVMEDYQGYRCTLNDGRRFYIRDAVVWNCYDSEGEYYGQAMLFDREKVAFAGQER